MTTPTVTNDIDLILQAAATRFPPPDDRALLLGCSSPGGFKVSAGGTPTPSEIVFSPILIGMTGTVSYVLTGGVVLTYAGNVGTLSYANMTANTGTVEVVVTVDGITYRRSITINKVFDGAGGATTYTHVKYADDAAGAGMSDDPTGKLYIGLLFNQTTPVKSTVPGAYAWSLLRGAGIKGDSLYMWLKYADDAAGAGMSDDPTGKAFMGIATNKATAVESDDPAAYVWSQTKGNQGIPGTGTPGARGAGNFYVAGSTWSDLAADMATPGATVLDDQVTISDGAVTYTKRWNGSAWVVPGAYLSGSLFVEKDINASKINTNGLIVRAPDGTPIIGVGVPLPVAYAAPETLNSNVTSLPTVDKGDGATFGARNRNDAPSEYPVGTTKQFKARASLASSDGLAPAHAATYCTLETIKQYPHESGGGVYQFAYIDDTTWRRYGPSPVATSTTGAAWNPWTRVLDRNAYTGALNASYGAPTGTPVAGTPAETVAANASAGASNAGLAIARLASMSANDVLDRSDKPGVVLLWSEIETQQPVLQAQATAAGVSRVTYDNQVTDLKNYLLGMAPAWNDYTQDTQIVRTTFNSRFNDVYVARESLRQAIGAAIAAKADAAQSTANSAANAIPGINTAIAARLLSDAATTLGPNAQIALQSALAILIGSTANGIWIGKDGIFGVEGGVTKFSLPKNGSPTFAGQLLAAFGTLGALHIAAGGGISGGIFTSWAWPAANAGEDGFYIGPEGMKFGNYNAHPSRGWFAINAAGDVYAPNFTIISGVITLTNPVLNLAPFTVGTPSSIGGTGYANDVWAYYGRVTATVTGGQGAKKFVWVLEKFDGIDMKIQTGGTNGEWADVYAKAHNGGASGTVTVFVTDEVQTKSSSTAASGTHGTPP